jgi:hypothetical protein
MEASNSGCPPDIDERSSCCFLANVEKVRLPEGFAFAAPEPSLIESCMTLGALSRAFFSSSRICFVLSVSNPPCAIIIQSYLLYGCALAKIRSLAASDCSHLRRLLAHMLLLLHVGSDGGLALSLGQLARVVGAAVVGEEAACCRPLEVCAESGGGPVADGKCAQGREWVHWRHC